MRIRHIYENPETKKRTMVWFGSIGKDENGKAIKIASGNFVSDKDALKNALTQKLSVIQHELWYDYQYGVPLVDKSEKLACDTFVLRTLNNQTQIKEVISFESSIVQHRYQCFFKIDTIFGNEVIQLP